MNEILLYLSLKYKGDWMAVYNSLQRREKVSAEDLSNACDQVSCTYTTLLDNNYPGGLKNIYKPPFGIFSYGKYELINNKVNVTILGDVDEQNKKYLDFIRDNGGNLLWVDLSNRQLMDVLGTYRTGNLFWMPEIRNEDNRTFKHVLEDEEVIQHNLFYSEMWVKDPNTDYSNQLQERMYYGLSHNVLVLTKLSSKQMLSLADYASNEDVKIVFRKDLFEDKLRKIFTKCKVWLIDDEKEILDYFFAEK